MDKKSCVSQVNNIRDGYISGQRVRRELIFIMKKIFLILVILLNITLVCGYAQEGGDARKDNFSGKVIIITGTSSGLGKSLAEVAAKKNMKLVLVDKNILPSQELAEKVIASGGEAMALEVDLLNPENRGQIISKAMQKYGRIDYLINNAAYLYVDKVETLNLQSAHDLFEVNFWAYLDLAQKVIPIMKEQGGGSIINIASLSSFFVGREGNIGIYSASKHALFAIFKTMAMEMEGSDINVKIVCPTEMKTNLVKNAIGPGAENLRVKAVDKMESFDNPDLIAREIFDKIYQKELVIFPSNAKQKFDKYRELQKY